MKPSLTIKNGFWVPKDYVFKSAGDCIEKFPEQAPTLVADANDLVDCIKLLDRIRMMSKDNNLSPDKLESRMIMIFNGTQELMMQKGMI